MTALARARYDHESRLARRAGLAGMTAEGLIAAAAPTVGEGVDSRRGGDACACP